MFAEKRARILSAACGISVAIFLSAFAHGQTQVFVDHFSNGSVTDSDTVPGFWQVIPNDLSTVTETVNGPETLTAQSTGTAGDNYPFAEISSTSLLSSANFFQQPIVLQASGLNYTNTLATALTEFNFGSQLTVPNGTVQTEYNEPSDFSLEICPPGGPNGQIIMGEKANATNKSTPFDIYELIGPTGHVTTGKQNVGGQIRSFELVLSSQYYYLSVISDTSTTNPTPLTTVYAGGLNLMNTGQYPWTVGTYAPGDPELNIETQIGNTTNNTDQAQLNVSQLSVGQLNLTFNPAGDGNYFTASNWSGLSGVIDPTTAANLKITVPDYTSSAGTFPQSSGPNTVAIDNGNGNTITVGTLNFNSTQPYTLNGSIVQFATNGSTDQINVTAGTQTINAELLFYDAHSNFNVASNATLDVNGPVVGNGALGLTTGAGIVNIIGNVTSNAGDITVSSGTGPLNITGDFASFGAITLNAGTGGMTINGGTNNDFLFHGNLTLNVAGGGTLTINSYIDDPFATSSPPTGTYPLIKTGAGLANVSSLYTIPSVMISGGTLRILPSTTANNYEQGGSLIYALSLSGGKLDLSNNDLVLNYSGSSPLATMRSYLQAGTLFSSTASLAHGTTVGYAEASEINQTSNFYDLPTDSTSLCFMYTYDGDLNMDGIVDGADYALMTSGNGSDWYNGDLNYDGVKNADDWALYQLGAAESSRGNINNLPAPEPGSMAMLGVIGLGVLKRKRR